MTSNQPRVTPGVPEGGRWRPFEHAESNVTLGEAPLTIDTIAQRHRDLMTANGFLPAVAHRAIDAPRSASMRSEWWNAHFVTAEYGRPDGEYAQMPDDFTPSRGGGRSVAGRRRTHRMAYSGSGVTLRMPSATSVKAYERESGGQTFDIPVSAETPSGTVSGWVRVTRSGDTWSSEAMGFSDQSSPYVAESVSAVLEARRPTQALRQVGDFLARRQARAQATGLASHPVPSTWINSVAYDDSNGTMIMDTTSGRSYGYSVPRAVFDQVVESNSPGSAYNKLVKGSSRVPVEKCESCGRYASANATHTCPSVHHPAPETVPEHNVAARTRAMTIAAAAAAARRPEPEEATAAARSSLDTSEQIAAASPTTSTAPLDNPTPASAPPPRPPRGHTLKPDNQTIDAAAMLADWGQEPLDDKPSMFGPRGWTVDAVQAVAALTDSTHLPFLFRKNPDYMDRDYGSNGDVGLIRFAGAGADEADKLLKSVPRDAQAVRQNDGPSLRSVAAVARRSPGKVEFGGYVVGPDRSDERISADTVYIFDDSENKAQVTARAKRMGMDFTQVPGSCEHVAVPWRPGERAWRLSWD